MKLLDTIRELIAGKARSATIPLERALLAGTASAGGFTVADEKGSLAETLRPMSAALQAGAQLVNVRGNLSIPKITTGGSASWLTETGSLSDTSLVFGSNVFTPHRLSAVLPISNQLLSQAPELAESALRRELAAALGYAFDVAVFSGLGASGEPLGLLNVSDFSTVTFGAAATRAKLASFEKTLSDLFVEGTAWVTSPASREKLRVIDGLSNGGIPLWSDEDTMLGKRAIATPSIPNSSSKLIFGNFSDLLIVTFGGGIEITVDPFTLKKSSTTEVQATLFADCGPIRNSFVLSTDSAAQ